MHEALIRGWGRLQTWLEDDLAFHFWLHRLRTAIHQWETSGRRYDRFPAVHAAEIVEKIAAGDDFTLLDVRSREEFESGRLPGAVHIYLGELPEHLQDIPDPRPLITFCGSGLRAVIAASLLKQNGFEEVEVCLGSMEACSEIGCPVRTGEE